MASMEGDYEANLSPRTSNDEFDFVLVDPETVVRDGDGSLMGDIDDDDDSYDYCEDACSMLSTTEEQSAVEEEMDTGVVDDMKDSILTVPDVLMKDLDEAHAAAKLVQMDDDLVEETTTPNSARGARGDHYSSASSVVSMEEDEKSSPPEETDKTPNQEEDSSSRIKNEENSASSTFIDSSATPMGHASLSIQKPTQPEEIDRKTTGASGRSDPSANPTKKEDLSTKGTVSMSRTSNKKRRKKLKLLKKAKAAASAAQRHAEKAKDATTTPTLSSSSMESSSSKQSRAVVQHQATTTKAKLRSTKKVTNVAVACATESMAAYREELILRGIK